MNTHQSPKILGPQSSPFFLMQRPCLEIQCVWTEVRKTLGKVAEDNMDFHSTGFEIFIKLSGFNTFVGMKKPHRALMKVTESYSKPLQGNFNTGLIGFITSHFVWLLHFWRIAFQRLCDVWCWARIGRLCSYMCVSTKQYHMSSGKIIQDALVYH